MTTKSAEAVPGGQGRVLVSRACFRRERLEAGLTRAGLEVIVPAPEESLGDHVGDVDAIVVVPRESVDADLVSGAGRARAIVSMVIGTDNIAVEEATRRGIAVSHGAAPENHAGMAESIVLLALALLHRLKAKEAALREGRWRPDHQGATMAGARIGLVGFGQIGREVVQRLRGWQAEITAHDPYVDEQKMLELGVRPASLVEVMSNSDVVGVQVTLTLGTRNLIGPEELAAMRPDAYLINTSRGGVVDEVALADALARGRIAGAAVDVWESEPAPADHPLLSLQSADVLLTGHNVGHAERTYDVLADLAVEHVVETLAGRRPRYLKNPEVWL